MGASFVSIDVTLSGYTIRVIQNHCIVHIIRCFGIVVIKNSQSVWPQVYSFFSLLYVTRVDVVIQAWVDARVLAILDRVISGNDSFLLP